MGFTKLRILAIDPTWYGFAYAVFENQGVLLDFGTTGAKNVTVKLTYLTEQYRPHVMVLEAVAPRDRRRGKYTKDLTWKMCRHAVANHIRLAILSKETIRHAFAPAHCKYERAVKLATLFPELKPYVPRKRKIYESEPRRANLFDAVALGVAFTETEPSHPGGL